MFVIIFHIIVGVSPFVVYFVNKVLIYRFDFVDY